MSINIKSIVSEALGSGGSELIKGNYEGWRIIARAVDSVFYLADDEDTIFMAHVFLSIDPTFFKGQLEKKDGKAFLEEVGHLILDVEKAYKIGNSNEINSLIRRLFMTLRKRGKMLPTLPEEKKTKKL